MPRRSSSRSSAPRRPTTTAAPKSAPAPAHRQQAQPPASQAQAHPPATQHAQPTAPAMGGGGGSFLGRVAELGAGIAVGHVAGRALENVFFGGRHASPEEVQKKEEEVLQGPCSVQYDTFLKCLKKNEDDADQCDWVLDMFKTCQREQRNQREYLSQEKEQSTTF